MSQDYQELEKKKWERAESNDIAGLSETWLERGKENINEEKLKKPYDSRQSCSKDKEERKG